MKWMIMLMIAASCLGASGCVMADPSRAAILQQQKSDSSQITDRVTQFLESAISHDTTPIAGLFPPPPPATAISDDVSVVAVSASSAQEYPHPMTWDATATVLQESTGASRSIRLHGTVNNGGVDIESFDVIP